MKLVVIMTVLIVWLGFAATAVAEALNNVSYASVTELEFTKADETLSYGEDPLQFALLWKSKQVIPSDTLLVFLHGGCWLNAYDIIHTKPLTAALAQQGYDVLSLEYRRTGDEGGGWPGSFNDISDALAHFLSDQELMLSVKDVVLMGHSAGGHLAIMAAANEPEYKDKVTAVIGLAAITDLPAYAQGTNGCQKATLGFMQGTPEEQAEAYVQANPRQQSIDVPLILLHGGADSIVPKSQAEWQGIQTVWVPEAGHFDWVHPDSQAFNTLLNTLETLSEHADPNL